MGTIDAWIVVLFGVVWLSIIALLIIKLFKMQATISELRLALAPFARMYERYKDDTGDEATKFVFKMAYDIYTNR